MRYFAGLDFGTSGARIIVIDEALNPVFENAIAYGSEGDRRQPQKWRESLWSLLNAIPIPFKQDLVRIALDGTSSTVLACDADGEAIAPAKLYNEPSSEAAQTLLKEFAPAQSIVQNATSTLAKIMDWKLDGTFEQANHILHQCDWLTAQLHGNFKLSDFHNALKLGFDPKTNTYPEWIQKSLQCDLAQLPIPMRPGTPVGHLNQDIAQTLGLSPNVKICAGTTDSIAAFLGSDASIPGDAVTSIGSTIAIKLLSQTRIDAPKYGIYSHWFGSHWLVGGASNAGGAVLAKFFEPAELERLSNLIDWSIPPQYNYVPLLAPGERFPIRDPNLEPCFSPKPKEPENFLKELLASLTKVEVEGYQKLQSLGASPLKQVFTAGGGAHNKSWEFWRQKQLGIPVTLSVHPQAAYGSAKLAWGCLNSK